MGVKADWHEDAVIAGPRGVDPFGMASSLAMAPVPPDITVEGVSEKLVKLFKRERRLFERFDLSCPIKDKCGTSCIGCPLSEAADEDSVKGMLCKVGAEQDQYETLFAALQSGLVPAPAPAAAAAPAPAEPKAPLW